MKEMARRDFLKLGAAGLAVASLGGSVNLGPLARKADATPVEVAYFECETMSFDSGSGISVVGDAAANSDQALRFTVPASAFKNGVGFLAEGSTIHVRARSKQNNNGRWPVMAVLVDGRQQGRWTINTTGYAVYTASISPAVAAGSHNIQLQAVSRISGPGTIVADFIQFEREDSGGGTTAPIVHGAYSNMRGGDANPQWGDTTNLDNYASVVGDKPILAHGFQQFYDLLSVSGINSVLSKYPEFMLTLESGGLNLDQIVAGAADADWRRIGASLAQIPHRVYVRLMHEMNGDWYSYSTSKVADGERKYRDAYRRFVNTIRAAGASNVLMVWCPNVRAPIWGGNPLANFYPGDDVVDILGLDGYAGWVNNGYYFTFYDVFNGAVDEMRGLNPNKPLWLCEWNCDSRLGYDKARFYGDALVALKTERYSQVKASIIFDSDQEGHNWFVDSSTSALAAYRALVNDPVYQGTSVP
jgi:beta-mannanase